MSSRAHHTDYDDATTARCERALLTLLGDLGPWRERIYLAGGLAPRYLIGQLPDGVRAHIGTTDIDLVIGLALGDETPETYRTLQNNLEKSAFVQSEPSFRWTRDVEGVKVIVEFLCETDQEDFGRIFRPKGETVGSKLGAFNVRGAQLARDDFIEREIDGDRLDDGGHSRVSVRVANVLPYAVLKVFSFQDRHENKDAYDLVFTLLNHEDGPLAAGVAAAGSPVASHEQVIEALALLAERFADADQDGPSAYALFLADPDRKRTRASAPGGRGHREGVSRRLSRLLARARGSPGRGIRGVFGELLLGIGAVPDGGSVDLSGARRGGPFFCRSAAGVTPRRAARSADKSD